MLTYDLTKENSHLSLQNELAMHMQHILFKKKNEIRDSSLLHLPYLSSWDR